MQKNNYDDKLFEAVLKIAAEEAIEQEMEEIPTCEELNEQYKPSPSLDKKIRHLISRHKFKEKFILWRKAAVKIAACFALFFVLSSAVLLSLDATRNYIFNAVTKLHGEYFSIEHGENSTSNIIIHKPTYLPEGFIEVSSKEIGDIIRIIYENENGITIDFKQSPSQTSHILADYEGKEYLNIIINNQDAYLFKATEDKKNTVIWEYNGIIFNITSEIESGVLIQIAESIKN